MVDRDALRRALARIGTDPGLTPFVAWIHERLIAAQYKLTTQDLDAVVQGQGREDLVILDEIRKAVDEEHPSQQVPASAEYGAY